MERLYAQRAMQKRVDIFWRNGQSYKGMPWWLNYLFENTLTNLEVSQEYHSRFYARMNLKPRPYKGAFV